MARQSKAEKESLHATIVANVLEANDRRRAYLQAAKLRAYLPYRAAREELRKHDEFVQDIQRRGIEALK